MINTNQGTQCLLCNTRCEAFNLLNADELNTVNAHRFDTRFKKGDVIFRQGMPSSNVVAIAEGLVKMNLQVRENKNLILGVAKGPIVVSGPGIYVDNIYHYTLSALTNVNACIIDVDIFKQLVRKNGAFADQFISEFSKRAIETYQRAVSLTQKQMHGRLAETLVYFSNEIFKSTNFTLPFSRQELADYTGMTKESVCRILKQFKDDKIIEFNLNNFNILDTEKLDFLNQHG